MRSTVYSDPAPQATDSKHTASSPFLMARTGPQVMLGTRHVHVPLGESITKDHISTPLGPDPVHSPQPLSWALQKPTHFTVMPEPTTSCCLQGHSPRATSSQQPTGAHASSTAPPSCSSSRLPQPHTLCPAQPFCAAAAPAQASAQLRSPPQAFARAHHMPSSPVRSARWRHPRH